MSGVLAVMLVTATAVSGGTGGPRTLEWDDLMPADWNPLAKLEKLREQSEGELVDGSSEADEIMRQYVLAGRSAPVVGALDGQQVRLPGYIVPLDFAGTEITEFLLVPYFGACIHVPPPPANQIVYVKTGKPYALEKLFDAVWVSGTLRTEAHLNEVGDAGYTMDAIQIAPYKE